ncbi:MAG: CsoS2 family carboxysome shell protein [Sedimenticolaceae bacterium]
MAQGANSNLSGRELALARRKAMSSSGKAAVATASAQRPSSAPRAAATPHAAASGSASASSASGSVRQASLARRKALSQGGKSAMSGEGRSRTAADVHKSKAATPVATSEHAHSEEGCGCGCGGKKEECKAQMTSKTARSRKRSTRRSAQANPGKAASLARRKALSTRGKAGISQTGMSEAQTARAANPQLSGRELAQALRESRSKRGSAGQKKSAPTGRRRKANEMTDAGAQDATWKVGASETTHGQTVTGTMVGRDKDVTGDEASTCRAITGTEYMGADVFREFCQTDPAKGVRRTGKTTTSGGNSVTGNKVGRATKVTGDEPGTCQRVTGAQYASAGQMKMHCGTDLEKSGRRTLMDETRKGKSVSGSNPGRSERVTGNESGSNRALTGTQYTNIEDGSLAPSKVGKSNTLRGGSVTGTMVGRRERMTGDEAGSCKNVTGDDYIGEEQYSGFCSAKPERTDRKVGVSNTMGGRPVSGTMTGRSMRVTGDEPGTCTSVTGTPYASREQYATYCEEPSSKAAKARMAPSERRMGSVMTGIQPGIGGVMTGAAKGACETISGTPYVGDDQAAAACGTPAPAATEGNFSIESSPVHASIIQADSDHVTGSRYERGNITGPFGMADGKVTGTEDARFGVKTARPAEPVMGDEPVMIQGREKGRITGEGQNAGLKITGDDWGRNDRVTGTEGKSSTVRNQTIRGPVPMGAMGARAKEPAETPQPVSKVTGSSGNTEQGSLITYSGGARG